MRGVWWALAVVAAVAYSGWTAYMMIIFDREAAQAHARVEHERARRWDEQLVQAGPRIEAALADPLLSVEGLLLIENGEQRLPRPVRYGASSEARAVYASLPNLESDAPWGERLHLLRAADEALRAGQSPRIESAIGAFFQHQHRYVLRTDRALASEVWLLERFKEASRPDARFLERRIEALMHALVDRRDRLTPEDQRFLVERVTALTRGTRVDAQRLTRALAPTEIDRSAYHVVDGRGVLRTDDRKWVRLRRAEIERLRWSKMGLAFFAWLLAAGLGAVTALLVSRARRQVQSREQLVASVTHELRTPLASIRLLAETSQRRGSIKYLDRLLRETDQLTFLVENILSYNRIDRMRAQRQQVWASDLVARTLDGLGPVVSTPYEIDLEEDARLEVDPDLFRLLLLNLTKNAAEYGGAGVKISIRAAPDRLEVEDDGPGLSGVMKRQVFEPFERGDVRHPGSGLGLSICRAVAVAHGGTITVNSRPGRTVFLVRWT